MLNYIWLALVVLAVAIGGWNNRLSEVTSGAFDGAKTAVTIALGLIGIMALWLGIMRLAGKADLVKLLGHNRIRWLGPDDAMTMDFSPERLNVMLDAQKRTITGVRCG